MINVVQKFKTVAQGYKYFPIEKIIIFIRGASFFSSLGLGYLDTGTFINPLYDFRYFIAGLFIVTIAAVISIFRNGKRKT